MSQRRFIEGIDYSYIDSNVANLRGALKISRPALPLEKGVLLSIHLQSNRPDNFEQFLDDLEASIDDPANIEVVVKIDDTDAPMNELLKKEVARRPFTVKYLSTPLVGGFFELWRSMNEMLEICDPNAYFLWNMNDEMAVLNKGWDSALKKYVGMFPDHIFRLRTSLFRGRNYCDFWECGFAPETSAITTKRWIDIGGGWNPCLGPDSFQQCVAYYFAYHDRFNKFKPMREVPVHDFTLAGEGAFIGLEGKKLWKRMRGATKAWFRLMSPTIQNDASKRAQKLHAHICAHENRLSSFTVRDNKLRGRIELLDNETQQVLRTFPYRISRLRIMATNIKRSPSYLVYGGGGWRAKRGFIRNFVIFLSLRFQSLEWLYEANQSIGRMRSSYIKQAYTARDFVFQQMRRHRLIALILRRMPMRRLALALNRYLCKRFNLGYPFSITQYPITTIYSHIDWAAIHVLFLQTVLPERFMKPGYCNLIFRCMLLKRWYKLSNEELQVLLREKPEVRYCVGVPSQATPPLPSTIDALEDVLCEQDSLDKLYAKAEEMLDWAALPSLPEAASQQHPPHSFKAA